MDPLSDVLRSIRLTGGIFLDAHFTAPWAVRSRITAEDCRPYLSRPAQVIAYHVVVSGRLLLEVKGVPPLEVSAGEVVLLPRNDEHVLASESGIAAVSADDFIQPSGDTGLAHITYGGGGAATQIVCGFLGSNDVRNPLISTLPQIMKLDVREAASRDWIEASVRFAAAELVAGRFADSGVLSRLSELLLVEAVRSYAANAGGDSGWLKGMSDPHVGRALALMHNSIGNYWTVDLLAREAALSRSTFVERFTAIMGVPPIKYLTQWRLMIAKAELAETRTSIAQIANSVGYDSEEAFSRAFKREFGESPARWRMWRTPE